MDKPEEILKKIEAVLNMRVGKIVTGSILKSNLTKMNKDVGKLSMEDFKILVENMVKSVSLFESKDKSNLVRADLENLLKTPV
jgi:hypothetical protein